MVEEGKKIVLNTIARRTERIKHFPSPPQTKGDLNMFKNRGTDFVDTGWEGEGGTN